MRFVETCQQLQIRFLVNMTVGEANYRHVYDTVLLARKIGALDIGVALVKPEGRGKQVADGQVVLAEVGRQVMLAKRDFEPNLIVRFLDPLAHIVDASLAQPGHRGGCGMGLGALHVQCNGNVLICTACKESWAM
jgi:MoaA/NifB/PqqE/SkfB family radical SAM enzyme